MTNHQQQVAEREYAYRYGMLTPNYLVPAIRLEVDICQTWDNEVHIWDVNTNTPVYSYSVWNSPEYQFNI